jgi:hypothetical protein
MLAGMAQSLQRIARSGSVIESRGGKVFRTRQDLPWGPLSIL